MEGTIININIPWKADEREIYKREEKSRKKGENKGELKDTDFSGGGRGGRASLY